MGYVRWAVLFCFLASFSVAAATASEDVLRFSLPPVLEALPVAFAQEWGLFEKHGVTVELVGISDNLQRSAALMTGNLDGLMSDVTHAVLDATAGTDLLLTASLASQPQTGSVALALLSPVTFRIESLEQLLASTQLIGVLYRSDYEYMLDQLVDSAPTGAERTARYSSFNDMLQLATMFGAQWLGSAVMPEPYITYIATYVPPSGSPLQMVTLDDFGAWDVLPSVVLFQRRVVEERPEAVAAFHAAVEEAIERLNATDRADLVASGLDVAVGLFFQAADTSLIGQDVLDALQVPTYLPMTPLPLDQYDGVVEWMKRKGYVLEPPVYDAFIDSQFLQ